MRNIAFVIAAGALGIGLVVALCGYDDYRIVLVSLVVLGASLALMYRTNSVALPSGAIALSLAIVTAVYLAGLRRRSLPVLDVNPTLTVALLVAVGMLTVVLGYVLTASLAPQLDAQNLGMLIPERNAERIVQLLISIGVFTGCANYLTGSIPALQSNIDSARFATDNGAFGRFWPLILAILQVSLILTALKHREGRARNLDYAFASISFIVLLLSGARALIGIPIIAIAMLYIHIVRPSILKIVSLLLASLALFGVIGRLRLGSNLDSSAQAYLQSRGLDSWLGSLDLSLQTGPRVFTRVVNTGLHADGRFIFGDLGSFLKLGFTLSDRYVNGLLGAGQQQLGGLPPTLFGGFYLDWGWAGVIVCSAILGGVCALTVRWVHIRPGPGSYLWFGYLAAYLITSSYSYVSAKPTWILVLVISIFLSHRSCRPEVPVRDRALVQYSSKSVEI